MIPSVRRCPSVYSLTLIDRSSLIPTAVSLFRNVDREKPRIALAVCRNARDSPGFVRDVLTCRECVNPLETAQSRSSQVTPRQSLDCRISIPAATVSDTSIDFFNCTNVG